MTRFLLSRFAQALVTLWMVATIVFLLARLWPALAGGELQ